MVFSCINICWVPRKLFEHEAARPSVQISSEVPGKCYCNEITMDYRCLRNRSALAVICWVINHFLEVSCKVDQITSAEREWFIYFKLTDKLWIITKQITQKSWSISILTHRKRRKSNCILLILPTFRHRTKKSRQQFDCNAVVYMHFLRCWREKNDVTPSNVVKTKTRQQSVRPVICCRINHWI